MLCIPPPSNHKPSTHNPPDKTKVNFTACSTFCYGRGHGSLGVSEAELQRSQQRAKANLMIPLILPSIISTTSHPC
ncbi:hypothetical protein GQ457_11G030520 [Hibiscus cannabinus]